MSVIAKSFFVILISKNTHCFKSLGLGIWHTTDSAARQKAAASMFGMHLALFLIPKSEGMALSDGKKQDAERAFNLGGWCWADLGQAQSLPLAMPISLSADRRLTLTVIWYACIR